jgi:hypothetical protein
MWFDISDGDLVMRYLRITLIALCFPASVLSAQKEKTAKTQTHTGHDSAFAAMQERGKSAMGVDQYTSTHVFDALPDGGRIELQRDVDDSVGVATIRAHMRSIARSFKAGDFSTPATVHLRDVPGAKIMAARRDAIDYAVRDLPRGAELRLTTRDAEALRAIHQFVAFQRTEHHATGRR